MSRTREIRLTVTEAEAATLERIASYCQTTDSITSLYPNPDADKARYRAYTIADAIRAEAEAALASFAPIKPKPASELTLAPGADLWIVKRDRGRIEKVHGIAPLDGDGELGRTVYCRECMTEIVNTQEDPREPDHRLDLDEWKLLADYDLSGRWGRPECAGCGKVWNPRGDHGQWKDQEPMPDPIEVGVRIPGARHGLRRKEAYRLLRHYDLPTEVLDIDYESGFTMAEQKIGRGVIVGAELTNTHPTKPRRTYYLRGNEADLGPEWAQIVTDALKIARGLAPTPELDS